MRRPRLEVLEDRLTPSFTWADYPPDPYPPGVDWAPPPPLLADFTSDGILDQIYPAAWNMMAVRPGLGDGTFGDPIYSYDPYAGNLVVADFNNDSQLDIYTHAGVGGAGDFESAYGNVLLGRGDGTFQHRPEYYAGISTAIGTGDINGDGRTDVVFGEPLDGLSVVAVLLSDGNWGWGPYISLSGATVSEGNTGTANATFTLTLANPSNVDLTFHYNTADGSAAAGNDYQAASGTLTIPAGQTTGTITVLVNGDSLPEPDETFRVYLSSPTNAALSLGYATGTIVDDEPRISIGDVIVSEGNTGTTSATFTVTLSASSTSPVTVTYATANGTATAGSDYQAASGTLTFAPGETSKTITVLVYGDRVPEPNETFFVNLSNYPKTDLNGVGS
jgi:hypothetical protein